MASEQVLRRFLSPTLLLRVSSNSPPLLFCPQLSSLFFPRIVFFALLLQPSSPAFPSLLSSPFFSLPLFLCLSLPNSLLVAFHRLSSVFLSLILLICFTPPPTLSPLTFSPQLSSPFFSPSLFLCLSLPNSPHLRFPPLSSSAFLSLFSLVIRPLSGSCL